MSGLYNKNRLFLMAHAGGNVWEYKKLFSRLSDITEMIPVELPADAVTFSQKGYCSFEEYVDESCRIISESSVDKKKAVLFGHSFGGYLAHEIAVRIPEMIRGVVISCCAPYHIYKSPDPGTFSFMDYFGYSQNTPKEICDLFEPLISDKINLVTKYCEKYKKGIYNSKKLSIPALIISADQDDVLCGSEEWYKYYDRNTSEMACLKGGHFYWHDEPVSRNRLIDLVGSFIRRV